MQSVAIRNDPDDAGTVDAIGGDSKRPLVAPEDADARTVDPTSPDGRTHGSSSDPELSILVKAASRSSKTSSGTLTARRNTLFLVEPG